MAGHSEGGHGGAAYVGHAHVRALFDECTFVGNNASVAGGAVKGDRVCGGVKIRNSTFEGNRAGLDGGAVKQSTGAYFDTCELDEDLLLANATNGSSAWTAA